MTYSEIKNTDTNTLKSLLLGMETSHQELVKDVNAKCQIWKQKLSYKMDSILNVGLSYELMVSDNAVRVLVHCEDKNDGQAWRNSHEINIYINPKCDDDYNRIKGEWDVGINWGSIGTVKTDDKWNLAYGKMIGVVSGGLGDIANFLRNNKDYEAYLEVEMKAWSLSREIKNIKNELTKRENKVKKGELAKSLKVGDKFKPTSKFHSHKTYTIVKLGPKTATIDIGWKDERWQMDYLLTGFTNGDYEMVG